MAEDKTQDAPAPQRKWRTPSPSAYQPTTNAPRVRTILFFCLLLAAIAGAVGGIILYLQQPPKPHFLALTFTEYNSDVLQHNAFANLDGDALRAVLGGEDTFTAQERGTFANALNSLPQHPDQTLVVYLRGYAVARKDGVLILTSEEKETFWYPLAEVLSALNRCQSSNKLLLLDIMRPVADARLGVLTDNVAAHVDKLLQNLPDSSLQVLSACSPGQVSLIAPGFQQSVFGYYVEQGLSGAADGYNSRRERDKIISVDELATFVTARVDRWAVDRGTRQTPILKGVPNDFRIRSYSDLPLQKECNLVAAFGDEPEWKLFDDLRDAEAGRKPSAERRLLQNQLMRAEQDRAGKKRIPTTLGGFAKKILPKGLPPAKQSPAGQAAKAPDAAPPGRDGAPVTKPTEAAGPNFREKLKRALDKLQIKYQAAVVTDDKAKPAGDVKPDKDIDEAGAEAKKKIESNERNGFAHDLVEVMALEPRANPMVLKWLGDMVESWPSQPPRGVQLVQKLSGPLLRRLGKPYWKGQAAERAVQRAFEAVRCADKIDTWDEETRRWIEPDVKSAKAKYDEGVNRLCEFPGDAATVEKTLDEAVAAYQRILDIAGVVSKAQRTCNEALAFLPDYAPYLLSGSLSTHPLHAPKWIEAAERTASLHELLSSPHQATTRAADIREAEIELTRIIEPLRDEFDDHIKEILRESAAEHAPASYKRCEQLHSILQTPIPRANVRKELWTALHLEEKRLHEKTILADHMDDTAGQVTPPLSYSTGEVGDRLRREIELAVLRGQVAIGLLQLHGFKEKQITDSQGNRITVSPAKLSDDLRDAQVAARAGIDLKPEAFDEVAVKLGLCIETLRPDARR